MYEHTGLHGYTCMYTEEDTNALAATIHVLVYVHLWIGNDTVSLLKSLASRTTTPCVSGGAACKDEEREHLLYATKENKKLGLKAKSCSVEPMSLVWSCSSWPKLREGRVGR